MNLVRFARQLNLHIWDDNVKLVYNETKDRLEWWHRCASGDREWILNDVYPGRVWEDSFINATGFLATILGFASELTWGVNGRRGGAVAPNVSNFVAANEIGGGIDMLALTGGNNDDYTAIHWGGNYPTTVSRSPHLKTMIDFEDTTDVAYVVGLVDDTRSTGTNAFALPDNGIYCMIDTATYGDNHVHSIVRDGGADLHDTDLGSPPVPHSTGIIRINDAGDELTVILNGTIVDTYSGTLPTEQLQPYFMDLTRDSGTPNKNYHLHDFRLIMDRGF